MSAEMLLTPAEIAERWKCSAKTVSRPRPIQRGGVMTDAITREEQEREYLEFHASKAGTLPSDFEVAVQLRMLLRDQLNFEAICVRARDKIAVLSVALSASEAEVERLREALEPFKIVGDLIERQRASGTFDREDEEPFNSGVAWTKDGQKRTLTWGDFRRARAAPTGEKK